MYNFSTKNGHSEKIMHAMSRFICRYLGKLYYVSGAGKYLLFKVHLFLSISYPHVLYHWIVSDTKCFVGMEWDGIIKHWWELSTLWEELRYKFWFGPFYFWIQIWMLMYSIFNFQSFFFHVILRENFKRWKIPTTFHQKITYYFHILKENVGLFCL